MMKLTITNEEEARKEIEEKIEEIKNKTAMYMEAQAKLKAPVKTGMLRASIHGGVEGNYIYVASATPYDVYVEYGSTPHEIKPKRRKALAFKKDGKEVIVKKVRHPGARPQPFLRPAANEGKAKLIELLTREFA